MISVSLAGSTGSIGTQAAEVIAANPDRFQVVGIGASRSVEALMEQVEQLHPRIVAIADSSKAHELQRHLPGHIELRAGDEALASLASESDVVVNGVVGFAGLPVTLATLTAGKRLALANKESLIAAGPLVNEARRTPGAELVPVDSEHGAIAQCLRSETANGTGSGGAIRRLILTASGGPFRGFTADELASVTVEQALAHPTWQMGPKITVDSSTLFNKGLEVIEAHELFGVDYDRIEVVVHPQSIVHSAVEYRDGSTIAQMSRPDMRLPIGYAMGYPERLPSPFGLLDWSTLGSLSFESPDRQNFPCLDLAYGAGRAGGTAPAWLNAANEIAVEYFLAGMVTWTQISSIIGETLSRHDGARPSSVDAVVEADASARRIARTVVEKRFPHDE